MRVEWLSCVWSPVRVVWSPVRVEWLSRVWSPVRVEWLSCMCVESSEG